MLEDVIVQVVPPAAVWIFVLFCSMLPIIECRGAIPLGMSADLWGNSALNGWQSGLLGFVGSTLVAVILLISFVPLKRILSKSHKLNRIFNFLENTLLQKFLSKITKKLKKSKSLRKKHNKSAVHSTVDDVHSTMNNVEKYAKKVKLWTVFLFCALPIPGTGVWSCAILACLLGLRFFESILCIGLGNLVTCLFVALLSAIFVDYLGMILVALGIVIVLYCVYKTLDFIVLWTESKHNKVQKTNQTTNEQNA